MLNMPQRKANATASPVRISVVVCRSVCERLYAEVLADDLTFVEDEDPVGERHHLLELQRDEQDRPPLVALGYEPSMEELDRADVDPARRLRGDQDLRVACDLACDDNLLLVAAGE